MRDIIISSIAVDTIDKEKAIDIVRVLKEVTVEDADVFSLDNTNSVEGFFSVIKRRLTSTTPTLFDVFEAIDFTERCVMARHNPASPALQHRLSQFILKVVTRDVLNVMTFHGVGCLLDVVLDVAIDILHEHHRHQSEPFSLVENALKSGSPIRSFSWMPSDWVLSTAPSTPTHVVRHFEVDEHSNSADVMPRIDQFLGLDNRDTDVFTILDDTLSSLYHLAGEPFMSHVCPATFHFFQREFTRFSNMSRTNPEMLIVLNDLCDALKKKVFQQSKPITPETRRSIVDPSRFKMAGPMTKSTSAKVDHIAPPQRTKTIGQFQERQLERKPRTPKKRDKRCSICRETGRYALICQQVLHEANLERSNLFSKD